MKVEYSPHGKCSYIVEGNIITIDATGPWNLEFFKKMHRELALIISNDVDYHNFAILLILKGESFATQDGLDYHLNLVKEGTTKALALNVTFSNAPEITQSTFKRVYNRAGLTNQCFNTTAAAKAWLTTQLT